MSSGGGRPGASKTSHDATSARQRRKSLLDFSLGVNDVLVLGVDIQLVVSELADRRR